MNRPLHTVIVSVVVRDEEGRLLLIKHPHRGWELPQGHVEQGEDLFAAASREVLEESGYEVEVVRLIAIFSKLSPEPSSIIFGLAARLAGGEATTSEESLEVGWFDQELALDMPEHSVNRNRLQKLLAPQQGVGYYSYSMSPFEYVQEHRI
ncbi:NUDIX hydrolase [Geopsychrobacter electrodiphilus]|uniref:NUDIX hydrolase n=1 Tax=Geopsychrobacter electrodiphilus TaxID=225196 RepID=UPI000381CCF5|nr:NUDIX hydrolase [Geopsychrobacter electrodiphilus]